MPVPVAPPDYDQIYSYDMIGNLTSGGRTFAWDADNLPASVSGETYTYDADSERVAKTVGGATTVSFQGIWAQIVGGASTRSDTSAASSLPFRCQRAGLPTSIRA
jgi:hypothetical protein